MKRMLKMTAVASSGMTLFSYGLSCLFREKFLETILLNQMVFPGKKEERKNHPAGFAIHYGVGAVFSMLYYWIWKGKFQQPGWKRSALTGLINGLIGVGGWQVFFTVHPHPPQVKYKRYYAQLLAAHVVFGMLNGLVYSCSSKSSRKNFSGLYPDSR